MKNKELYKESFSRLHASGATITEMESMKDKKPKFRITKLAAVCAAVLILAGAVPGITYAATDGETANPFHAVKIWINGEPVDGEAYMNPDGTMTVKMEQGDTMKLQDDSDPDSMSEVEVETSEDMDDNMELQVNIDQEGVGVSVEDKSGDEDGEKAE